MISQMVEQIRVDWANADAKRDENLSTPKDVIRVNNLSYGSCEKWNLLDIYYPQNTEKAIPVILSVHGGAWVYGTKETYQYYCMNLAQRGFAVVNFNYRLAPENQYPDALEDINSVLCLLPTLAATYPLDIHNLFVVGDSAGAQLASQYLTILTNPDYAKKFDFTIPDLRPRAVALNCGMYDLTRCAEFQLDNSLREYTGVSDVSQVESLLYLKYITGDFPPTYLASACHDHLLVNTAPMYKLLMNLGVDCQMKIYGSREQKEMSHVFHLNIKLPGATECNTDECNFFKAHCGLD